MAKYFAGNSLAAFSRTTPTIAEVTTAGRFDSAFVSSGINLPNSTDYIQTPTFSATGTIWLRADMYLASLPNAVPFLTLRNGTTAAYRLTHTAGTGIGLTYWNGSSFVSVGTAYNGWSTSTRYSITLKIVLNSSWELFFNGTSVASGSGITGAQTTITDVQIGGSNTNVISQVMIADYDLRDSHLMAAALNGNSAANTGGTGSYTDINETVLDESTSETVATSGNKMGQTHAAITVPSGLYIAGMVIGARGRATGTITDGKLGIRSGGTNFSSTGRGYTSGYEPRIYLTETDPATATTFTQSGFNAAETYIEAV